MTRRRLFLLASLALLAFELWRFSEISAALMPLWQQGAERVMAMPWWVAALTAFFFAIQAGAAVFALLWVRRLLSHFLTRRLTSR